jgi:hypothetical protein
MKHFIVCSFIHKEECRLSVNSYLGHIIAKDFPKNPLITAQNFPLRLIPSEYIPKRQS